MKRTITVAVIMVASALGVAAQTIRVPESWDKLAAKAENVTNLTLDKSMLQLGLKYMKDGSDTKGDAATARLLSKLKGIYVRDLEFKNEGEFTEADVEPIRAQLQGPEWLRMLDVTDKTTKESVQIYVRQINGENAGIVVLAEEARELTFVHLDGPLDFDDISALSGNFGIPQAVNDVVHANPGAITTKPASEAKGADTKK